MKSLFNLTVTAIVFFTMIGVSYLIGWAIGSTVSAVLPYVTTWGVAGLAVSITSKERKQK